MNRLVLLILASCALITAQPKHQTALDRYVASPDSHYKWELASTIEGKGYHAYVIELTSQKWRDEKEVDKPLWKHWLTIIRPETVNYDTGFMYITGGGNKDWAAPKTSDIMLTQMALDTNSVVAELKQIPSEPLVFADEPGKPLSEDGIITYTWEKFLKGGDETWPLRLPMTKASVRAMDTITAFGKARGNYNVGKFIVSGGSKRGWTTWTTAAVDQRVVAIAPAVIDVLNMEKSMDHHYRAYGFFAPSVGDYMQRGIMDWAGSKEYKALLEIEEPFQYRDRFTMPKYVLNAAGDQFFLPDSSQFYWNDLKGEKLLRYVPNSDHSMRGTDVPKSLTSYVDMILRGVKRPEYSWKVEKNGDIHVKSKDEPSEVNVWMAVNPEARDFRVEKVGRIYKSTPLAAEKKGEWIAKAPVVEKGYAAYFVELTYPTGGKYPLKVTTQVKVMPDTYPSEPYKPAKPMGTR